MDELIEHQETDVHAENSASQSEHTPPIGLDKNRKIAVAVLGLVAVILMIFWIYNLRRKITDPFTYKGSDKGEVAETSSVDMTKDTDNDGLTDYEETNVYNTSPYLDDSDSDGVKDGDEVKNNTNPNCAIGADCNQELVLEKVDNQTSGESTATTGFDIASSTDQYNFSAEEVAAIRQGFITAGYDKAALDKLSDQEVIQAYIDAIKKNYEASGKNNTENKVSPILNTQSSSNQISSSDATNIRDAYIKAGYKKEDLDKISDADLVKAYKEAIAAYQNNTISTPIK